ncbi:MAG: helix-turn-helix transcriptional regulator [Oscillospiraceae bacterium]|nr:helix-turn-helix transcriptional regulator [Oscillospiraceae bacterium]
MVKNTIGGFLAALRRAHGMTQRELGEKLGVSDKAVSRWERDECAPDLTLIPVLAEIFDVTSDEILRGQRLTQLSEPEKQEKKTEKQVNVLLRNAQTKLSNRSLIAIGIAVTGLLVAMICNSGFNRAYIGFFAACIFYAAAVVCQFIFTASAFNAVNSDVFQTETQNTCKYTMATTAFRSFSAVILLFIFTLPLIIFPWNGQVGILIGDFILYGALFAVIALGIIALVRPFVFRSLSRRGVFELSEQENEIFEKLNSLAKNTVSITLCVVIATAIPQFFVANADSTTFVDGTVFDNFEDFKAFMETPEPEHEVYYAYDNGTVSALAPDAAVEYYDENGNVITKEEAMTEHLYDNEGNIVYTYMRLNNSVSRINYSAITEDNFHVTVYTDRDISRGLMVRNNIMIIFYMVYAAEIIIAIVIYIVKRRKITEKPC